MEEGNEWFQGIGRDIARCAEKLGEKASRKFKLSLLLGIAKRVDPFAAACQTCGGFKNDIGQLAAASCDLPTAAAKDRQHYFDTIQRIVRHLREDHQMVMPGYYISIAPGIGATFGIAVGSTGGNLGVGIGLLSGAIIGAGVGLFLDNQAKKNNRVI